jgi:Uma2 family endonuclease
MAPEGTKHAEARRRIYRVFTRLLAGRAEIQSRLPFAVNGDLIEEPDFAVIPPRDYSHEHPDEAHLIVEVADAPLVAGDRGKLPIYAGAGVPEYWLVNLDQEVVEVYRAPEGDSYRESLQRGRGDIVGMLAFPDVELRVDEILPTR